MSSISADLSISEVSRPKHPAFPTTAPPTVPGRPIHGIKVGIPLRVTSILQGDTISPEARRHRDNQSDSFPLYSLRIMIHSKQSVAKRVFDHHQRKNTGISRSCARERIFGSLRISSRLSRWTKYRALLVVRKEVRPLISANSCTLIQRERRSDIIDNMKF